MTSPHEQAVQEAVERAKWVAEAIERRGGQSSIISISVTRYFAADLRTLLTALEEVTGELEAAQSDGWQPIETAPRDGTPIRVLYDDGSTEDGVYWSAERCCILGPRAGAYPPGWNSTEADHLPVGDGPFITHWRPPAEAATPASAPTQTRDDLQSLLQASQARTRSLEEVLREIIDPVPALKARSTTGHILEGVTESVDYLRAIAQAALQKDAG